MFYMTWLRKLSRVYIIYIFLKGFLDGKKLQLIYVLNILCWQYGTRCYNRIKGEKKGYYLCKKLSKHSTAKSWILYFVESCLHWLMTMFVFIIYSILLRVFIFFKHPPFTSNFLFLGETPQFLISPPLQVFVNASWWTLILPSNTKLLF